MSTESLFATQNRILVESALGSGTAGGDTLSMPLGGAAAVANHLRWEARLDPFRNPRERLPIHTRYRIRTSHSVNPAFAAWLIAQHAIIGTKIRHQGAPTPSFALQFELEDGDAVQFSGATLEELQISMTERRAVTMECSWQATSRTTGVTLGLPALLPGMTRQVSTLECAATIKSGDLDAINPRGVDAIPVHAAEWILTRTVQLGQHDPDGQALAVQTGPWRVLGELTLPASSQTEAAIGASQIATGLWIGPDGSDLGLTSNNATAVLTNEPLQGEGFREHTLRLEFRPDSTGTLAKLKDDT